MRRYGFYSDNQELQIAANGIFHSAFIGVNASKAFLLQHMEDFEQRIGGLDEEAFPEWNSFNIGRLTNGRIGINYPCFTPH